jgi:hypothetical protein
VSERKVDVKKMMKWKMTAVLARENGAVSVYTDDLKHNVT